MFALSIYTYNLDLLPIIVNSFLLSFYFSIINRIIYCSLNYFTGPWMRINILIQKQSAEAP